MLIFDDELWIATSKAIDVYNFSTKKMEHFYHASTDSTGILGAYVMSLSMDADKNIWVGTGVGLCKIERKTRKFHYWTIDDGLPNDMVYSILHDNEKNIWVSTNRGLSKFNPERNEFYNYDVTDGLQSNEFNQGAYFKDSNGKLYFGAADGNYENELWCYDGSNIERITNMNMY